MNWKFDFSPETSATRRLASSVGKASGAQCKYRVSCSTYTSCWISNLMDGVPSTLIFDDVFKCEGSGCALGALV